MTRVEILQSIKADHNLNDEQLAFVEKEIESLAKKANAPRKPTANQTENETTKNKIVGEMNAGVQYSTNDIMTNFASVGGMSRQKVVALISQLVVENRLVRTENKRKVYFSLPLAG